MAISPDNHFAITAPVVFDVSDRIYLWDLQKGKPVRTLLPEEGWAGPVGFSVDGKLALCTRLTKKMARLEGRPIGVGPRDRAQYTLWDLAGGQVKVRLEGTILPGWGLLCGAVLLQPAGRQVLAQGRDYHINWWDMTTGKLVRSVRLYPGDWPQGPQWRGQRLPMEVRAFALSPEGGRAAMATGLGNAMGKITIQVWDLAGDKLVRILEDYPALPEIMPIGPG
jgi:WD40 repeat protein